ncbi:hypothetical protein JXA40_11575 [bacterium]|nr:hypothetical protein [candidate division CSSED10-310 bacterium]
MKTLIVLIVIAVLAAGMLWYGYNQTDARADRFVEKVRTDVLRFYDGSQPLESISHKMAAVAITENIRLDSEKTDIRISESNRAPMLATDGPQVGKGDFKNIAVTMTFQSSWLFLSRSYEREIESLFRAAPEPPTVQPLPGMETPRVNTSSPARDLKSHRDSIGKAVGGQME